MPVQNPEADYTTFHVVSESESDDPGAVIATQRIGSGHQRWLKLLSVRSDWMATLPCNPHLAAVQYAIYCITGVKGSLWHSARRPEDGQQLRQAEMNAPFPAKDYYYHYTSSTDSPSVIPSIVFQDRALTSTQTRSKLFCQLVEQRDSNRCVVTGFDIDCHKAQVIPHSEGDATVRLLSETRATTEREAVEDIDDERNGLLLYSALHSLLSKKRVAFLPMPSFCIDLPETLASNASSRALPGRLPDLSAVPLSNSAPAVLLLTEPDLSNHISISGVEPGRLCRIFPGRTSIPVEERRPLQLTREGDARYPEIWMLNLILADFFTAHFGADEGIDWLSTRGKDLENSIMADNQAAVEHRLQDSGKSGDRSKRQERSDDSDASSRSQKRYKTTTHAGQAWDCDAWGPPGFSIYRALACMPTAEALAARKAEAEKEERRIAEQAGRSKQATTAWIAEQRREASQNEAF